MFRIFWGSKKEPPAKPVDPALTPLVEYLQAETVEPPEPDPGTQDDRRMDPAIKARWVARLRSGKYVQGEHRLKQRKNHEKSKYCCLGVLAEMAVEDGVIDPPVKTVDGAYRFDGDTHVLGEKIRDWAGLEESNPTIRDVHATGSRDSLAELNDNGKSFSEIADIIEQKL